MKRPATLLFTLSGAAALSACGPSSTTAPATSPLRGDYITTTSAYFSSLSFLDDTHYAARLFTCETGSCAQQGTYELNAQRTVLTLNPDAGESVKLALDIAGQSGSQSAAASVDLQDLGNGFTPLVTCSDGRFGTMTVTLPDGHQAPFFNVQCAPLTAGQCADVPQLPLQSFQPGKLNVETSGGFSGFISQPSAGAPFVGIDPDFMASIASVLHSTFTYSVVSNGAGCCANGAPTAAASPLWAEPRIRRKRVRYCRQCVLRGTRAALQGLPLEQLYLRYWP